MRDDRVFFSLICTRKRSERARISTGNKCGQKRGELLTIGQSSSEPSPCGGDAEISKNVVERLTFKVERLKLSLEAEGFLRCGTFRSYAVYLYSNREPLAREKIELPAKNKQLTRMALLER